MGNVKHWHGAKKNNWFSHIAIIKGKLDLLFLANEGERDKMLTTDNELDNWINQL